MPRQNTSAAVPSDLEEAKNERFWFITTRIVMAITLVGVVASDVWAAYVWGLFFEMRRREALEGRSSTSVCSAVLATTCALIWNVNLVVQNWRMGREEGEKASRQGESGGQNV